MSRHKHLQVKSSVQRGIRSKILDQYPMLEPIADELLPKKTPMFIAKLWARLTLFVPFLSHHAHPRCFTAFGFTH